MRLAIPLVALVMIALVGCGGGDDETTATVPLAQRFLTAEDAPGSKPDPVEKRATTVKLDELVQALSERMVDPDTDEVARVFKKAGFKEGGADARFFGQTHTFDAPHVFSSEIELESEDGAKDALDLLETDTRKPCPENCAVERNNFDVGDVSDGRGIHRIATAKDIAKLGFKDQKPFDSYWVGFTAGPVVYTMELRGPPGSVSEQQAQQIASAYYDRLTGS